MPGTGNNEENTLQQKLFVKPKKRNHSNSSEEYLVGFNSNKKPKSIKKPKSKSNATQPLRLSNRYQLLSDNSESETDSASEYDQNMSRNIAKTNKPPPIIILGKPQNQKVLTDTIHEHTKKGYHIKYSKNNTNIYIYDTEERKALISELDNKKIEFYTYTENAEKTHAFVIRGLDSEPELQEIKEELEKKYATDVKKIFRMKNTSRPLYLITTSSKIKLKEIAQKVKYLNHTRITWERHVNKKEMIQCHRCQMWGHATSNCRLKPACLKCAGEHLTNECKEDKNSSPKCKNCNGDHTANSINCPTYKQKISMLQERRNQKHQTNNHKRAIQYIPAPPPKNNAWHQLSQLSQKSPKVAEFPPLPSQKNQPISDTQITVHSEPAQINGTSSLNQQSETSDSELNNLNNLFAEINKLNNLMNIQNMTKALKALNSKLAKASSKTESFTIFINFTSHELSQYNI